MSVVDHRPWGWYCILDGTDNSGFKVKRNHHVFIPKKTVHRIENIGDEILEFVETQIGDYLGEDDIIRYSDDYNRT